MSKSVTTQEKLIRIDLFKAYGETSLNESLDKVSNAVIEKYSKGFMFDTVITSRGVTDLQQTPLVPIPGGNGANIEERQKMARDKNKRISKTNEDAIEQSVQCVGWILQLLTSASAQTVKNHTDYSSSIGPNACRIEGRVDLQRFIKLLYRIKAAQSSGESDKLITLNAFNECRQKTESLEDFEAEYGRVLGQALTAGNVIDAGSSFRCQHFYQRLNVLQKYWTGFHAQYPRGELPEGLKHTDFAAYVRRTRTIEKQGNGGKIRESSDKGKGDEQEGESAHMTTTTETGSAKSSIRCPICAGFNIVAPNKVSKYRSSSHSPKNCKIAQEVLKHKEADSFFIPPMSRFDEKGGDKRKRGADKRGKDGKNKRSVAMMAGGEGKSDEPDSD